MRPLCSRPETAMSLPFGEITAGPTVTSKSKATFGGGRMDDLTTAAGSAAGLFTNAKPSVTAASVAAAARIHGSADERARADVKVAMPDALTSAGEDDETD